MASLSLSLFSKKRRRRIIIIRHIYIIVVRASSITSSSSVITLITNVLSLTLTYSRARACARSIKNNRALVQPPPRVYFFENRILRGRKKSEFHQEFFGFKRTPTTNNKRSVISLTTKAEKGIIEAAKKEKRRHHVLRKWFKKKRVGELGEESHRIVSRVDGAALVGRDCRGERVWGRFFFVSNRLFFLMMSGKCVRLVFENVPAKENAGMKEDGRPLYFSLKRFFGFSLAVVAPRRRALGGFSHRASIVHPSDGRCFVVFRVSTAFFFVSQSSFCFFVSTRKK